MQAVLEAPHRIYTWQPDRSANPYRALLAQADVLVVTGESESMLAEAAATTAPLYILPVTESRPTRIKSRLREWCVSRAHAYFSRELEEAKPANPVDAIFAWLMRKGLLRTRRNMDMLHQALFASGRARPFGEPIVTAPQSPLPAEAPQVARWLKNLLQWD